MVWIHGGSFVSGGASTYDAVVVTANYRLGDEIARLLTDELWSCTAQTTRDELRGRVSGYEFAQPDMPMFFPGLPEFPGGYGAFHASEIPLLFEFEGLPLTAGQRALSDYVIAAWGRFARTGDPGWRAGVQSLEAGAVGPADFRRDHQCGFWSTM